jgi:predicted nucleic acid-binding protein
VISVQVLNEFGSVATRRFGLAIPEVREILATICAICTVKPLDVETQPRSTLRSGIGCRSTTR